MSGPHPPARTARTARTAHTTPTAPTVLTERAIQDGAVPRFEVFEWAQRYGLLAGITARPLNLGLWSDESAGEIMGRWRVFRTTFAGRFPEIVLSHQVHGTAVRWHDRRSEGWLVLDGFDGHATAEAGVLLTVTVADCIPVYLALPAKGMVALLHAGWRGTAARVLERGVGLLCQAAAARASELVMHCGVGICGACYEVGNDVREAVAATLQPSESAGPDAAHVDLRHVLARQAAGLGLEDVSVSSWCSAHDRDRFFSHRASGGRDGRMVAYLGRVLERA